MPASITRSRDIRAVFAARHVAHGRGLSVYALRRADDEQGRVAVVAGRRVGGAVKRNRAKRRLRALLHAAGPPAGTDLVVVAAPPAVDTAFAVLSEEFTRLRDRALDRAGAAGAGSAVPRREEVSP
jgi:ribonuclease P protein component